VNLSQSLDVVVRMRTIRLFGACSAIASCREYCGAHRFIEARAGFDSRNQQRSASSRAMCGPWSRVLVLQRGNAARLYFA
jgi:hypothetical protein